MSYYATHGTFAPFDDDMFWQTSAAWELRSAREYQETIERIRELVRGSMENDTIETKEPSSNEKPCPTHSSEISNLEIEMLRGALETYSGKPWEHAMRDFEKLNQG